MIKYIYIYIILSGDERFSNCKDDTISLKKHEILDATGKQ